MVKLGSDDKRHNNHFETGNEVMINAGSLYKPMMITGKNRKNLADKHRLQTQTYM